MRRGRITHTLCRPFLFLMTLILHLATPTPPDTRQAKRKRQRQRKHLMPQLQRPAGVIGMFAMLSVKAIKEKIADLTDRAQAIVDLANQEKRDLTDEEKTEIDNILGVGKKGDTGYKPGQIDRLESDLARAEALEQRQAQLAANRAGGGATPPQRSDGPANQPAEPPSAPRAAAIRIPAAAQYRHGNLKAFHGPHAEQEAYLCGQFLLATVYRNERAAAWCRDNGIQIRAAMTEGTESAGGYLVPTEFEQRVIDLREEYGIFRREAMQEPMGSDTKNVPTRASGLTAYFVGENTEITASDAAWGQVTLTARKLGALCKYSSELSEDAIISMADRLTDEIAYAFAIKEDACGFLGDGTAGYGSITGLINAIAAGSTVTAAAGNLKFGSLDLTDFEAMIGRLPRYPGIQPKWHISQAGWSASMMRLLDAAGGNTSQHLSGGSPPQFLGYDVVINRTTNSTLTDQASTDGLCYFGDLKLAAILGSRRGIAIATSADRYFELDQLAIKGTERFDIQVHGTGDATDPGPVIMLSTPAA